MEEMNSLIHFARGRNENDAEILFSHFRNIDFEDNKVHSSLLRHAGKDRTDRTAS